MSDKCIVHGCNGEQEKEVVSLRIGCARSEKGNRCNSCNRVYYKDGTPAFNRPGFPVYLFEGDSHLTNLDVGHLLVYRFKSEAAARRHWKRQGVLAAEICLPEALEDFEGQHIALWNPRTSHWVPLDKVNEVPGFG